MLVCNISILGYSALTKGMTEIRKEMVNETTRLKRQESLRAHDEYRANLSGSKPSTSERPLPVGVRSGDLLSKARIKYIPSGFRLFNTSGHAGYVELGTKYMTPRRPLGDVVDRVNKRMRAYVSGFTLPVRGSMSLRP